MADGPRCKRRKQANPRRNNGEWRRGPGSGGVRGSRAAGAPRGEGGEPGRGRRGRAAKWSGKVESSALPPSAAAAPRPPALPEPLCLSPGLSA